MKNRCVIVAGGDCDLHCFDVICDSDYIIAADSGLKHLNQAGIIPKLIVGDFDSFNGELPDNVEVVKLPTHKDDTDLLFALRCAVEREFGNILILGGYGSRPDQNLAMMQSLVWCVENSNVKEIKALCRGFEIYAINNATVEVKMDSTKYLSVFCLGEPAHGVSILGAEYPLNNATVTSSFPIGVSNEGEGVITLSVKSGTLIIMTVDKNI